MDSTPETKIAAGFVRIAQVMGSSAHAAAGAFGLSALQVAILSDLETRQEALPVSFFANHYRVTLATISDSIRLLEEKHLVTKQRDAEDGRWVLVAPTQKGRQVLSGARSWIQQLETLISGWDKRRQEEVLAGLVAMIASLQAQGRIPTDRMCVACRFFMRVTHPAPHEAPYRCEFINAPLRTLDLRLDCPDFEPIAATP